MHSKIYNKRLFICCFLLLISFFVLISNFNLTSKSVAYADTFNFTTFKDSSIVVNHNLNIFTVDDEGDYKRIVTDIDNITNFDVVKVRNVLAKFLNGDSIVIGLTMPAFYSYSDNLYYLNEETFNLLSSYNASPFVALYPETGIGLGFSMLYSNFKTVSINKSFNYNGTKQTSFLTFYYELNVLNANEFQLEKINQFMTDLGGISFGYCFIGDYNPPSDYFIDNEYFEFFMTNKSNVIYSPITGGGSLIDLENEYNKGYQEGYDAGYDAGYNAGYSAGLGESQNGVKGLLLVPASILGTLFRTVFNWLNFTIFGINLWSIILFIGGFGLLILLIKMFSRGS